MGQIVDKHMQTIADQIESQMDKFINRDMQRGYMPNYNWQKYDGGRFTT